MRERARDGGEIGGGAGGRSCRPDDAHDQRANGDHPPERSPHPRASGRQGRRVISSDGNDSANTVSFA